MASWCRAKTRDWLIIYCFFHTLLENRWRHQPKVVRPLSDDLCAYKESTGPDTYDGHTDPQSRNLLWRRRRRCPCSLVVVGFEKGNKQCYRKVIKFMGAWQVWLIFWDIFERIIGEAVVLRGVVGAKLVGFMDFWFKFCLKCIGVLLILCCMSKNHKLLFLKKKT